MQRHKAADVAHQLGNTKNQIGRGAVLHPLAIDLQPQAELLRIGHLVCRHQPGAHGGEGVRSFALVPLAAALELKGALRHIVHQHITSHIGQGVRLADIAGFAADDYAQLHFPVGLEGAARDGDRVIGAGQRAVGLEKKHRFFGRLHARFAGVVGVIEAHAHNFPDLWHRAAPARALGQSRQAVHIDCAQGVQSGGRQVCGAPVGYQHGDVAGHAVAAQNTCALLARRAKT